MLKVSQKDKLAPSPSSESWLSEGASDFFDGDSRLTTAVPSDAGDGGGGEVQGPTDGWRVVTMSLRERLGRALPLLLGANALTHRPEYRAGISNVLMDGEAVCPVVVDVIRGGWAGPEPRERTAEEGRRGQRQR